MTNLTSSQFKLVCICGILVLLIPIGLLGMPSSGGQNAEETGGMLARLRREHDLGEGAHDFRLLQAEAKAQHSEDHEHDFPLDRSIGVAGVQAPGE